MSLAHDRVNGLTKSQQQWLPTQKQASQLSTTQSGGTNEPSSLAMTLLTIRGGTVFLLGCMFPGRSIS